jgi:hypothetical protein
MVRVLAAVVLLLAALPSPVRAQRAEVVVTPLAGADLAKLSPDLRSAVVGDARFVGISDRGRAVLEGAVETLSARFKDGLGQVAALDGRTFVLNQVVVVHAGAAPGTVDIPGTAVSYRSPSSPFIVITAPDGLSPAILRRLAALPWVTRVEPDYPYELFGQLNQTRTPDDLLLAKQWGLSQVGAERAWNAVTDSKVIVAILDSGLQIDHKDLSANLWKNPSTAGSSCPGDVHGCDFTGAKPTGLTSDPFGHGTAVAGVAGAVGNNAWGVTGLAWRVPIMGVRIFGDQGEWTTGHKVAAGIDYAVALGARVINASWGGPILGEPVEKALEHAFAKGVLVVAASGNAPAGSPGRNLDVRPIYPACLDSPNIITVMASDLSDAAAPFAHFGKRCVDLAAPGVGIYTLDANGGHAPADGTSVAAPFVSAAAALLWSTPGAGAIPAPAIRQTIIDRARDVPAFAATTVSGGVLDVSFLAAGPVPLSKTLALPPGAPAARGPGGGGSPAAVGIRGEWTGTVNAGVMAIGAETTGVTLRTSDGTFELQADGGLLPQLLLLDGQDALVRGTLRVIEGIEIRTRRLIQVTDILRRD